MDAEKLKRGGVGALRLAKSALEDARLEVVVGGHDRGQLEMLLGIAADQLGIARSLLLDGKEPGAEPGE